MKRWLGWIAIGWLLALAVLLLAAYGNPAPSTSPAAQARAVEAGLRCPVCQGESVADSPSGLAGAMRAEIRRRLAAGETPEQIDQYFVSRYGEWILLSPPASGIGFIAWLAPPLLVVGGLALLATLVLDWRHSASRRRDVASAYLARVRAELEEGVGG